MNYLFLWPGADLSAERARRLAAKALANHWHKSSDLPLVTKLDFKTARVIHKATLALSDRTIAGAEQPGTPSSNSYYSSAAANMQALQTLSARATPKQIEKALQALIRGRGRSAFAPYETGNLIDDNGRAETARRCPANCSGGMATCTACYGSGGPKYIRTEQTCRRCGGAGYVRGYMGAFTGELTTDPNPYGYTYDSWRWVPRDIPCPAGCKGGRFLVKTANPQYCPACEGVQRQCRTCAGHGNLVSRVSAAKVWTVLSHHLQEENGPSRKSKRRSDALQFYGKKVNVSIDAFRTRAEISSEVVYHYWAGRVSDNAKQADFEICGTDFELFNFHFKQQPLLSWRLQNKSTALAPPPPIHVPYFRPDYALAKVAEFSTRLLRSMGF